MLKNIGAPLILATICVSMSYGAHGAEAVFQASDGLAYNVKSFVYDNDTNDPRYKTVLIDNISDVSTSIVNNTQAEIVAEIAGVSEVLGKLDGLSLDGFQAALRESQKSAELGGAARIAGEAISATSQLLMDVNFGGPDSVASVVGHLDNMLTVIDTADAAVKGLAVGSVMMNVAVEDLNRIRQIKLDMDAGIAVNRDILDELNSRIDRARALGVLGSTLATAASTNNQEEFSSIAYRHLGGLANAVASSFSVDSSVAAATLIWNSGINLQGRSSNDQLRADAEEAEKLLSQSLGTSFSSPLSDSSAQEAYLELAANKGFQTEAALAEAERARQEAERLAETIQRQKEGIERQLRQAEEDKRKAEAERAAYQKDLDDMALELGGLADQLRKARSKADLQKALDDTEKSYKNSRSYQRMLTRQVEVYNHALDQLTGSIRVYEVVVNGQVFRPEDVPELRRRLMEQENILKTVVAEFERPGGLKDQYEAAEKRLDALLELAAERQKLEQRQAEIEAMREAAARAQAEAEELARALESQLGAGGELVADTDMGLPPPVLPPERDQSERIASRGRGSGSAAGAGNVEYIGTVQGSLSLVGDYRFEGDGGNSFAGSGALGDGTPLGSPAYVAGVKGQALHVFGDESDRGANALRVAAAQGLKPGENGFVIEALVNIRGGLASAPTGAVSVLSVQGGDFDSGALAMIFPGTMGTELSLDSGGAYGSYAWDTAHSQWFRDEGATVPSGEWALVRYVVDRESRLARVIVNGKEITSGELIIEGGINPTLDMLIGAYDYVWARNGHARYVTQGSAWFDDLRILEGQFGDIEPLQQRLMGGTASAAETAFMAAWDGAFHGYAVHFLNDDGAGSPQADAGNLLGVELNQEQTAIAAISYAGDTAVVEGSYFNQKNDLGAHGTIGGADVWIASAADPDLLDYDYLTWGTWQREVPDAGATGSSPATNLAAQWIAGRLTPAGEVPTTGTGTYGGAVSGLVGNGGAVTGVRGDLNLTANFGSRTMTGGFANMRRDDGAAWKDMSVSAGWGAGTNAIAGTLSGTGISGSVNGNFFGPNAREVGGSWQASGSGDTAAGIFRGKQ